MNWTQYNGIILNDCTSLGIPPAIQARMDERKKELAVDKKETSKNKLKKMSAPDSRPGAVAMGSVLGIGIICVVVAIIVLPDIPRLVHDVKYGPTMARCEVPKKVKTPERIPVGRRLKRANTVLWARLRLVEIVKEDNTSWLGPECTWVYADRSGQLLISSFVNWL